MAPHNENMNRMAFIPVNFLRFVIFVLVSIGFGVNGFAQNVKKPPRLILDTVVNFKPTSKSTVYPILHETGWQLEYQMRSEGPEFRGDLRQAVFADGRFLAEEPLYGPFKDRLLGKSVFIPTSRLARVPMTANITLYLSPPSKPDVYLVEFRIEPVSLPLPRFIWELVDISENTKLPRGGKGLRAKVRLYAREALSEKSNLVVLYGRYPFSRNHRLPGRPFIGNDDYRDGREISFSFPYSALSTLSNPGKRVFLTPGVEIGGRLETGNISIQIPGKRTLNRQTLENKFKDLDRKVQYWIKRAHLFDSGKQ